MNTSNFNQGGFIILEAKDLPQLAEHLAKQISTFISDVTPKSVAQEGIAPTGNDKLIPKNQVCEILNRSDSCLSKWAKIGKLVPIKRGGSLYYRYGEVMMVYNGKK